MGANWQTGCRWNDGSDEDTTIISQSNNCLYQQESLEQEKKCLPEYPEAHLWWPEVQPSLNIEPGSDRLAWIHPHRKPSPSFLCLSFFSEVLMTGRDVDLAGLKLSTVRPACNNAKAGTAASLTFLQPFERVRVQDGRSGHCTTIVFIFIQKSWSIQLLI